MSPDVAPVRVGRYKDAHPSRGARRARNAPHTRHGSRKMRPCQNRCFCVASIPESTGGNRQLCCLACSKTVVHMENYCPHGFGRFSDLFLLPASPRIFPSSYVCTSPCGITLSDSDTCGSVSFRHLFSVNLQQRACSGFSPDSLSSQPVPPAVHGLLSEACTPNATARLTKAAANVRKKSRD